MRDCPMPSSVATTDRRSTAARTAARARWGPPRVARLDDLTPEQRAVVLALVAAAKAAKVGTS